MRKVEWLVRWFTAEDWRTWVSHFLLVFFIFRAVVSGLPQVLGVVLLAVVIFAALYKEAKEYNQYRDSLDGVMDALAYIMGAFLAAASIGLF